MPINILPKHILLPISPTTLASQSLLTTYLNYWNRSSEFPAFNMSSRQIQPTHRLFFPRHSSAYTILFKIFQWLPTHLTSKANHELAPLLTFHFSVSPSLDANKMWCLMFHLLTIISCLLTFTLDLPGHSCLASNPLISKFPYPSRISPFTTFLNISVINTPTIVTHSIFLIF